MLERDIERRMNRLIRERGGLTYKFSSPNSRSVPDRIVITSSGEVWFVELKTTNGNLTKLQQHHIDKLKKQGANACVLYGWEAAFAFVEELFPDAKEGSGGI